MRTGCSLTVWWGGSASRGGSEGVCQRGYGREGIPEGVCQRGVPEGGCAREGDLVPGGVVSEQALKQTPPVNRMTDRCKNITLAGNKLKQSNFTLWEQISDHYIIKPD